MSGFSFPPPPPPPPKSTQAQQQQYLHENGGRGRGRGRGSFRGSQNQRGGHVSGSHGNYGTDDLQRSNLGRQRNAQQSHSQSHQVPATLAHVNVNQTPYGLSPSALPPGTFVNPRFAGQQYSNGSHAVDRTSSSSRNQSFQPSNGGSFPPRTAAGQKRKLDALREPGREKKTAPPTAPPIPGFGTSTLPAKLKVSSNESRTNVDKQPKSEPARRSLGLVPRNEDQQYSSSDNEDADQDVDEEAVYAELGDKLTFEHNGVLLSLNSVAELEAWKKERRKNYPTAKRKAEKYAERQRIGEERKRLLACARVLQQVPPRNSFKVDRPKRTSFGNETNRDASEITTLDNSIKRKELETGIQTATNKVDERTKQLDELRRKVALSEEKNRKARARQVARDEDASQPALKAEANAVDADNLVRVKHETEELVRGGDGVNDSIKIKIKSDVSDEPDVAMQAYDLEGREADFELHDGEEAFDDGPDDNTSASSSSISSDSSDEPDSDEEPPEELDSKPATLSTATTSMPVCRYFAASGRCRDGNACRFKHESRSGQADHGLQQQQAPYQRGQKRGAINEFVSKRSSVHKKGIFERLKEQEQEEENRLALKVIKYLGSVGFFQEPVPVKEEP